jgi:hypothetical protein
MGHAIPMLGLPGLGQVQAIMLIILCSIQHDIASKYLNRIYIDLFADTVRWAINGTWHAWPCESAWTISTTGKAGDALTLWRSSCADGGSCEASMTLRSVDNRSGPHETSSTISQICRIGPSCETQPDDPMMAGNVFPTPGGPLCNGYQCFCQEIGDVL